MRTNRVVFKLFVITALLIAAAFTIVLLAQGLFFERFYRSSKLHALERSMKHLAQEAAAADHDQQMSKLLGTFMNSNDAGAALLNHNLERIVINPYYVAVQAGGKLITVLISPKGMKMDAVPHGIHAGDSITVDGIYMDEADTVLHPVIFQPHSKAPEQGLVRVSGLVAEALLPEQRSSNPYYEDALLDDALQESIRNSNPDLSRMPTSRTLVREWTDEWSGFRYAVLLQPVPDASHAENSRYLLVMASLQPVGEAVGVLKHYFIYLTPLMFLLAIVLSVFYSRIIARPLVQLNRLASRLAKLDFTAQPVIKTKDEFGQLSQTLMEMSRSLDAAMQTLTAANEQLAEDMREKQRSEALRKELIANLSHELKTPLGIVKGFAEGLQDGIAGEKKELYLALIVSETDRMNAMIMDMLELSKYEAKAIQLQTGTFPISGLIRSTLELFTPLLESKKLTAVFPEQEQLVVEADAKRIEQVLSNLFSNAIRYAVQGSAITIEAKRTAEGTVAVSVENTGPSIAEADLPRVWEPFYRADRSRDRQTGGTGLGLAIVKHILELHGSEYDAANTDHGVTFSFTLKESRGDPDE
ncbi:sensor histidine kinase [Paenibacillus protaetiae]|uniref:histidine kinase n=1 Tax=Paenibacillus protaetiae TaxID=2509456 RepID=A0A4P6F5V9_9BACL|nr:ATP-binding protein [Paenibacillus protaetiae]QAY65778.1 sensor histidine kinase [Paenibacillus protaetiae]